MQYGDKEKSQTFHTAMKEYLKNILGWRTKRKLVALAVDDYGNIRMASKQARERLDQQGFRSKNRYDIYDTLETEEDLQALFEVLDSVKDKHGKSAVLTALSIPVNIDFEKMAATNNEEYHYELLPVTLAKLKGYERVWDLWKEGIAKGLLSPQFHGREHFNLRLFKYNLAKKDPETLACLKEHSYVGIQNNPYQHIRPTGAFCFEDRSEVEFHKSIIEDGLNQFEKVFGVRSRTFNAPGAREHSDLHETLHQGGVTYIESPVMKQEHQGDGKYKRMLHYTGKKNKYGQTFLVRNCQFEPSSQKRNTDWVKHCLKQVEAAFTMKKPAIISSHRVNFCGLIDEGIRKKGLTDLQHLLQMITKKWPEIEFVKLDTLGDIISKHPNANN